MNYKKDIESLLAAGLRIEIFPDNVIIPNYQMNVKDSNNKNVITVTADNLDTLFDITMDWFFGEYQNQEGKK